MDKQTNSNNDTYNELREEGNKNTYTDLLHHADKLREGPVELVHERVQEAGGQRAVVQQRLGQKTLEHLGGARLCTHTHTHTQHSIQCLC